MTLILSGCGNSSLARQDTGHQQSGTTDTAGTEISQSEQDGNDMSASETTVQEDLTADAETFSDQNGQMEGVVQDTDLPVVYMSADISAEGLLAVYEALDASPSGNIAVKLSTGEPGSNYLQTDLIGTLVQSFDDPTIDVYMNIF